MKKIKYTFCPTCITLIKVQNKDKYIFKLKENGVMNFFCSQECLEKYKRKKRILKHLKLDKEVVGE